MIILILIIALVTFLILYGSYHDSTNNNTKAGILFMGIIIPLCFLFAFWVEFSKFPIPSPGFIDKFLMKGFWLFLLSALSLGSIVFLIIVLPDIYRRKKMFSNETKEQRSEREATERKLARERTERSREVIKNNRVIEAQIKQAKESQELKCPKCSSTNLTANTKGFGLGKAAVGGVLLGPVGLLGGVIGSKKAVFICLHCGNQFQK